VLQQLSCSHLTSLTCSVQEYGDSADDELQIGFSQALSQLTQLQRLHLGYGAGDTLLCSSLPALRQLTCFVKYSVGEAVLQHLPPQLQELRLSYIHPLGHPVDMSHLTTGDLAWLHVLARHMYKPA